jgi:SPP1 family phage portal protein
LRTYQDYATAVEKGEILDFIRTAITEYMSSKDYKTALDADEYEAERNVTINEYARWIYNSSGQQVVDFTAANNKIASNFLHRLVTQRITYSLGNGISFPKEDGEETDTIKEKLGKKFDTVLFKAARYARLHKVSYLFWNLDHADFFKMTEFCPLYDEEDGRLKAGLRFWSLNWGQKPVTVVLYEQDGYTKYRTKKGSKGLDLAEYEPKRAYKQTIARNEVDPEEVIGESNYSDLPIIPFWGSSIHQSDLVGMRAKIDSYDLVKSGFCNDLQDCAQAFFIVSNALGMTEEDLAKFRDRLKLQHIAVMDTDNTDIKPYQQEIPSDARSKLLDSLYQQIYDDYGAMNVQNISGGQSKTATEIDAAYQPMDEEADDFEYQVIETVQGILALMGIDAVPLFNRNRVSNQKERTEMIMLAANYLDEETLLNKLPFVTPDEIDGILVRKGVADQESIVTEE